MLDLERLVLIANTAESALVSLGCWWVAHQFARAEPPGRLLAMAYSLFGFTALVVAFARLLEVVRPEYLSLYSKGAFLVILAATAYRNNERGKDTR